MHIDRELRGTTIVTKTCTSPPKDHPSKLDSYEVEADTQDTSATAWLGAGWHHIQRCFECL